ncbi:MAG: NADH-quinone oxidoreductase subunit M [Gammaproteobacteria bacterium]|jgi:NADH-quinone oxidoreductase subunit M|uniref:NADH-quinone oxidoreductase subunit M n=1 Tax=Limnobacter profundi TaxID=2732163 RepID=A0ABX6N4E8_9BURK|nr:MULTISPECIES: NADH-quinone oxidoreductase subunit M [unclassified Limnobacter]MAG80055.1 NADH-quinone oxidoreductase subunit M [Sutterellaceae bacterium]MBA4315092.1 NADH-quinone oxidoreductase subunit M [Alcaligenaceae bacterium]MBU0542896.1 NADH-quinone oxidoreductase subunit M [Gammaproteobacteria bacterium]PZO13505.1 MAG: NADH-quinone oxidoreductase subunit M [Betaproteobacteria bacterium]MBT83496.1 NADH-quinone oxidoreductase subunit M [Sutterellaceae bacterium]|tara:strand:+ start:5061 stop:6542 length:1482 start_codon:yes stop_codon:yes gene_type:complete
MSNNIPYLSLAIWLPIAFGVLIMALGNDKNAGAVRGASLIAALISFLVTLPLYFGFDTSTAQLQFVENLPWIEAFGASYGLGVDGLSVWFVILTALITIFVVVAAWEVITEKVAQYMAAFLILSGLMVGVFAATDGLLFYVFFEATLIPMYIIVGVWGGPNRIYAAFKFFLYTLLGSLLTLVAIIYLQFQSGTFEIAAWHKLPLGMTEQILIFLAFLMAFAVKVPMWPVHTWLPDAHVEAPTGGSVVLAAIMLKLGAYGFLRFSMPIAPDASHELAGFMITLSLIAVVYIGVVALVQKDMKKLVAYSSIAHMGFVTLGFFMFQDLAVQGAIIQMISHGFVSGAMFLCIGVLYDRVHSREISAYGGVVNTMPKFAAFFLLFAMANSGLPATSGFVGEFMVILGAVKYNFWIGLLAATTLIFGAAYSLWMYKRVVFGEVANDNVKELTDVNTREFLMLGALAILVMAMGLYPKPFTDVLQVSVDALLQHVAQSKL